MPSFPIHRRAALVVGGAALAVACAATAQDRAKDAARTSQTFSGQAAAGRELYAQHCASCHGLDGEGDRGPRLVGLKEGALPLDPPADRKQRRERFAAVAEVADYVIRTMPPRAPGGLARDEYWAIVAFDLHANGIDLPQKLTPELARSTTIPR